MIFFNPKIRFLFLGFVLLCGHGIAQADVNSDALNPIQKMVQESSRLSEAVLSGRHYWIDLAGLTNTGLSSTGAHVGVGYRWKFFGVDLRYSYGKTRYGGISVLEDSTQTTGPIWAQETFGSELERERSDNDQWNYSSFEPGISIESKLFLKALPLLTQRARVGFAYGKFQDEANAISFTSYLLTIEAALIYQLGEGSPFAVTGALQWNTGDLVSTNDANLTSQADRHLPVNWIGSSFGFLYSF
jgi:hypothetical protein